MFNAPWMPAFEGLLDAISGINEITLLSNKNLKYARVAHENGFHIDKLLLDNAIPYSWSKKSTEATLLASHSLPLDTLLNSWNMDTPAVWWYFEDPLPFHTVEITDQSNPDRTIGVRALCFGWLFVDENVKVIGCSAWTDAGWGSHRLTPSQTWIWSEGQLLSGVIETSRREHAKKYGPGGKYADTAQIGSEAFGAAVEGLSRFVIAGLAWINQKIVAVDDGHVERHRRKELKKKTGREISSIKVVELRRRESRPAEPGEAKTDWTCQWEVDGHWRNQAYGPGRHERRLQWVNPYRKGPDDKPFRVPQFKVYRVSR